MKTSLAVACGLALAVVCFLPASASAQFGFGFGGGDHGGGGLQFGFGSGGISIGSGNQGGWGGGHYGDGYDGYRQPRINVHIPIPSNNGWNQPNYNNYSTPRPQYSDRPVERPKPTPKPVANVKPAVTDPNENKITLVGRHITADEIARAKEFFQKQLDLFAATINGQLPAADVDLGDVIAQLVAREVDAAVQIRLIDALRAGNINGAREIWTLACPGVDAPFGMPRLRVRFASFCEDLRDGACTMDDMNALASDMEAMGMNEEPCCGAESLLEDIKEHLQISHAVARAIPGKPSVSVAIPAGEVDIVYHPSLPDGSVLVLDAETVMVGTGGVGKFEMERGNVAAAVGYPLSKGEPMPESEAKLIRSGVLIENSTDDAINYLVDSSQFSIQPDYRQTIASGTPVVKFDRGNGGKAATYKLAQGTYRFTIKSKAFEMVQAKFSVTIDNSLNLEPFQYIVQGEHATVAAGQTATHKSDYPIVIRYDRGNGGATKQVLFEESEGTLQVAVNLADNLWDLFQPAGSSNSPELAPSAGEFAPAF